MIDRRIKETARYLKVVKEVIKVRAYVKELEEQGKTYEKGIMECHPYFREYKKHTDKDLTMLVGSCRSRIRNYLDSKN